MLTATIALSPTAAELTAEAELMRKIDTAQGAAAAVRAGAGHRPPADRNPNFSQVIAATMTG